MQDYVEVICLNLLNWTLVDFCLMICGRGGDRCQWVPIGKLAYNTLILLTCYYDRKWDLKCRNVFVAFCLVINTIGKTRALCVTLTFLTLWRLRQKAHYELGTILGSTVSSWATEYDYISKNQTVADQTRPKRNGTIYHFDISGGILGVLSSKMWYLTSWW